MNPNYKIKGSFVSKHLKLGSTWAASPPPWLHPLPRVQLSRMHRLLANCYFEEHGDVAKSVVAARLATELEPCAEAHLLLVKFLSVADLGQELGIQLQVCCCCC